MDSLWLQNIPVFEWFQQKGTLLTTFLLSFRTTGQRLITIFSLFFSTIRQYLMNKMAYRDYKYGKRILFFFLEKQIILKLHEKINIEHFLVFQKTVEVGWGGVTSTLSPWCHCWRHSVIHIRINLPYRWFTLMYICASVTFFGGLMLPSFLSSFTSSLLSHTGR